MAGPFDFLTSIFGGGEQQQPNVLSTQDLINQSYGVAQQTLPQFAQYNQQLQPVMTGLQLANQNQIFGPAANSLQKDTYQSILDQLHLGTSLPQDLQQQVVQNALQGAGTSGFGVGVGGRGLVAKDLGLTGLDLLNQRQNTALGAVNQLPLSHYVYQPQGLFNPTDIAGDIRGVEAAKQEYAAAAEKQRQEGFANLLRTGLTIAGTVAGGIFGGGVGAIPGAAAGQLAGNILLGQPGGGGGGFGSILSGLGGGPSPGPMAPNYSNTFDSGSTYQPMAF